MRSRDVIFSRLKETEYRRIEFLFLGNIVKLIQNGNFIWQLKIFVSGS